MVNLVRDDSYKIRRVTQQISVKNDFAASQKTRRENFIAWAWPKAKLAPMRPHLAGKRDA